MARTCSEPLNVGTNLPGAEAGLERNVRLARLSGVERSAKSKDIDFLLILLGLSKIEQYHRESHPCVCHVTSSPARRSSTGRDRGQGW